MDRMPFVVVLLSLGLSGSPISAGECACRKVAVLDEGVAAFEHDDFTIELHSRVNLWGGWVGEDSLLSGGAMMQEPGFRLRRARLGVEGSLARDFSYALELDLFDQERSGGPLYTARVGYEPSHWFGLAAGVDKFLLVRSEILSSGRLPHLDRPLGTLMMSPANALGLVLYSWPWEEHLKLSVGLYNGLRRNSSSLYDGYEGVGISLGNRFDGLAAAARFDLEPLAPVGKGLADLGKKMEFRFGVGAGGFLNGGDRPLIGGGSLATSGLSGYLHGKFAGAHIFGEYTHEWVTAQPQQSLPTPEIDVDSERFVANLSLGYIILRNRLGVAVRGEWLEPHVAFDDEGDELAIAATATWYFLGDYVKAQVEYLHRRQLHGAQLQDDAAIGGLQLAF